MKEIDTIREAIEGLLEAANHNVGGMVPGVIATWCHKALATLSTIDPDAIRMKVDCTTCANACQIDTTSNTISLWCNERGERRIYAAKSYCHKYKAAILGTEPARESSRAISFDGWFYVFTDQTTGKLESFSSYKNAAAALDKILATEPAREGS